MNQFCQDRDLLGIEPVVFVGGGFAGQQLIGGAGGVIAGTSFTASGANFQAAGVQAGMVLCVWTTTAAEGVACEILAVDSPTQLTVTLLRAATDSPAIPPAAGSQLSFRVRTYQPQIQTVSDAMAEKLRLLAEAAGIRGADFVASHQLRQTAAVGVLANVFVAMASNASDRDANWIKAEHYGDLYRRQQLSLRLAVDADGDGAAEQTRTLGNVTLRRA